MTSFGTAPQARMRRIGWVAALGTCLALYALLHIKVTAVHADVVRAERQIVALEEEKLLLETEFLTRSNHVQLAAWNRVDFGFESPTADQFIESPRQLAAYGMPRSADAPAPIRLAGMRSAEDVPDFPQLVSPLTGRPVDEAVLGTRPKASGENAIAITSGPLRVPLAAVTISDAGMGAARR